MAAPLEAILEPRRWCPVDGVFNLSERNGSRATINKYIPRKLSEEEQIYIYIYTSILYIHTWKSVFNYIFLYTCKEHMYRYFNKLAYN